MVFIPNKVNATFPDQAQIDTVDLDIIIGAQAMTAVMYGRGYSRAGCAVTPSSGMTLAVASGEVRIRGKKIKYAGGTIAMSAANATNPRMDLVTIDNTGTLTKVTGTAAASPGTQFPALPVTQVCLAMVYIPANDTVIDATQIIDKRIFMWDLGVENVLWYGALGDGSTNDQPAVQAAYDVLPDTGGHVVYPDGQYKINTPGITVTDKAGVKSSGIPGKANSAAVGGASLVVGTDGMTLFTFQKVTGTTATHSGPTFEHLGFEDTKPDMNVTTGVAGHWNSGTGKVEFTKSGHTFAVGDVIHPYNWGVGAWNDTYPDFKITAGSWVGGTATITTSGTHGLVVGQWIVVAQVTPSAWNGTYQITAKTTNTLSFAKAANPGAYVTTPGQGGIVWKAWVVDTVVGSLFTAIEPDGTGKTDSTGSVTFEIMHNPPTATLLRIAGSTRWYVRRCTFTSGIIGLLLDSGGSKDVSWGTVDWCTFAVNKVGIKMAGDGGSSVEIVGGDWGLHTAQIGIQGTHPEQITGAYNMNHVRIHGMKVDTRYSSGNGCWFIDAGPISRFMEFGPFNLELEGDSRAIRAGGTTTDARGGHGVFTGVNAQHNDSTRGYAIEVFGGDASHKMEGLKIIGTQSSNFDTAIYLGPYCQSVQIDEGNVSSGNTGVYVDALTDGTAINNFTSIVSQSGYTHIDDHGTNTHGGGNYDIAPASKHRLESVGGIVYTSAPANTDGLDGEMRLAVISGVRYIYGKIAGVWYRSTLT